MMLVVLFFEMFVCGWDRLRELRVALEGVRYRPHPQFENVR